jgi:ABC-type glycerol-3-phosphate transport system substrate-binding protein
MNNKLSPFQLIMFVILIIIIIIAVGLFAFRSSKSDDQLTAVTMWGVIDSDTVNELQNQLNTKQKNTINLVYTQKKTDTFESDMIEALASGNAPDLFLLPDSLLLKQQNKLFKIPYTNYPQRDFKTNFIEGSEILLTKDGIWGLPFMVDPMVLYWNRGKLNNSGLGNPPEYWDDFIEFVPKLVVRDSSLNIQDAAVALGEYKNIRNAKSIFLNLLMQAGNPVVTLGVDENGVEKYESTFSDRSGYAVRPADAALTFFAQFSNPTKDIYTWNRSLPNSDEMFLSNDLAFYLGFASEYKNILEKNPNLNFDVAIVPQSKSSDIKKTIGNFYFLTISKNTKNVASAYAAINVLTSKDAQDFLTKITDLPPVRRDLLSQKKDDSVTDTFYRSALISKAFLDPNPTETSKIISDMIESFTSSRAKLTEAIDRAGLQMFNLIK